MRNALLDILTTLASSPAQLQHRLSLKRVKCNKLTQDQRSWGNQVRLARSCELSKPTARQESIDRQFKDDTRRASRQSRLEGLSHFTSSRE